MGLDAIGIISKDLQKSKDFYSHFGIEFKECGGPDHLEATLPNGLRLMMDSVELIKKLQAGWKEPQGSGMVLCFKQESSEAVNQCFTAIEAATQTLKGRLLKSTLVTFLETIRVPNLAACFFKISIISGPVIPSANPG